MSFLVMLLFAAGWRLGRELSRARRAFCRRGTLVALLGLAGVVSAAEKPPAANGARPDLAPAIELAPFVVKGEKLSISILARSKADRTYAEKFAADVIEVAYATLDKSPGAGLVIAGAEHEPHPVFLFRKFVQLAQANQLDPTVAGWATEASELMRNWEQRFHLDDVAKQGLPLEMFVKAMPLQLEGIASKLYQIAWAEGFNDPRVEQKLRALTPADLATDQLSRFDWVFYLPPRDAFGEVMKEVVPAVMKKNKLGLFQRAAVRTALVAFAPAVKKAVEAARKGMLFMTVFRARSGYNNDEVMDLTAAYVRILMPDFKFNESSTKERAIAAIEAQKITNAEYANDPFVSPSRLDEFDATSFAKFTGAYALKDQATNRFVQGEDGFTWQFREQKPARYFPAGERLLVSENGRTTLRFFVDENGTVTGAEEKGHRRKRTFVRAPAPPAPKR